MPQVRHLSTNGAGQEFCAIHAISSHVFPISHISICCNAGNRTSQALLGLQLSPDQQEAFQAVIQELEVDFTFTTLPEDARRVFDMFIQ